MASKTLSITYTADAARALAAQKQIDAGHTKMTGGLSKVSSGFKSTFGSLIPLSYAAAGLAAVGAAKFIIDAASNEGEALNKARVIFEKSADTVVKFSDQSASAFGISKAAALEAAGGYGAMFESAGLAEKASADMSVTMVKLAADMASFNNQDPSEMLEKLRSGLAGEAEPLRQFGVFISEAAVQQEAYQSGIAKTGEELTDAQKIQARYNLILGQTQKQQGDFARTIGESLPNQIRKFKAEMTDLAADIGSVVLPVLLFLATHVELVVAAFVGFAAAAFVPNLLLQIAIGLEAIGAGGLATRILGVAASVQALGFGFSALLALDLAGLAYLIQKIATGAAPTFADELGSALADLATDKVPQVNSALVGLRKEQEKTDGAFIATGKKVQQLGEDARKAMQEFKQGVVESTHVVIGQFENMKDAFSITPKELRHQLNLAVDIAKQFGKDLKAILTDPNLTQEQKRALSELPPEYRRAFVESGKAAREQLADDAVELSRLNKRNWQDFADDAKGPARSGGHGVGAAMMDGAVLGIAQHAPELNAAVAKAVRDAIAAGRKAAGAASPSKRMQELGVDMMVGLADGISDAEQKAIDAARKAIEKSIDTVSSALDKLKGKASSFRDAIRSGFGGFLDLSGAFGLGTGEEISGFVQGQVAGASQLADVLQALKAQGAGKGLLAQIAGGGAEAIPFAQALLQGGPQAIEEINASLATISGLAKETGKALSEHFFGEKIDRLEAKLDRIHDDLRELNGYEREGHSHDINMDGEKVAEGVRRQLQKTGQRNVNVGLS